MRQMFVHEFEDDSPTGDFDIGLDLPEGATLEFSHEDGGVWVTGNRAGWAHLARVCAELGLGSEFPNGYHFHRSMTWGESTEPPEVTFELGADDEPV